MEIRNVSKDKLRACIYGIHDNEINNISSCTRLAGESIDAIDIASLCLGTSATITLKQAELIMGIRKAFNFICDEYDFNDCTQLIISLGKLIGTKLDDLTAKSVMGEDDYKRWKSCNSEDKTVMERAVAWFASIVYYEPFESMNEVIAYLMFNKVLIENGAGYAVMTYNIVDELKAAIKRFKEGQFTECPEQLSGVLWNLTTTI